LVINSLLTDFTQIVAEAQERRQTFERGQTAMRDDFDAIPEAERQREGAGCMLVRIYHDIGLAAVADALNLLTVEFDADLNLSLERGEFYLLPADPSLARAEIAA
jgi:hypothetical protein